MIRGNEFLAPGDLLKRHGLDAVAADGDHHPGLPLAHKLGTSGAELRGEHTVDG